MAHGWDSYFHNLPPLASDPSTVRTSESDGNLSPHIENFTGHHDFPGTVASHEAPATNSNFNTNFYSNPSIGNSSSDCVYQKYFKDAPWQADGEQMEKEYLPRCGNGVIDFATDGLSASESFPSSFPADFQGLKQDCGILATSFLEDYSDVSSCSDADIGETRPSCKFMGSNSLPKTKTDISVKQSSSEWLFTHPGNMTFPLESPRPVMSETSVILPSPSNVKAEENIIECAQDKMESPEDTAKYDTGHSQSSKTPTLVTTTGSETVKDRNECDGSEDQKQKDYKERDLTQGEYSNILISVHENLTVDGLEKYPDGSLEGSVTANAPNILAAFNNEQDHFDGEVLRKEMNQPFSQVNVGLDNSGSTDGQDRNMKEDEQDQSEVLRGKRKESGSFENENFGKQKSPNANSTVCQDENMETDYQEKEIQSNICQSSDPQGIKVFDCNDAIHELIECTNTLKRESHVQTCLQISEHQSCESVAQVNICSSPAVMRDGVFSDATDKNEQSVAGHFKTCLEPNCSNTEQNPCLEKEWTSAAEKTNATSLQDPGCNGPGISSDCGSIDPSTKNKLGIASYVESYSEPHSPSTDINPSLEKKVTSPLEKTINPPMDADCTGPVVTNDTKEQSVCNSLQFCLQSDTSCTDINPCLEKNWTSPEKNTNTASSPDRQTSLHQTPVALKPESLGGDVAENATESFEEMETCTEEPPVLDILYGEPLSREDSSCDYDETKHDTRHSEDTSLVQPDGNGMNQSEELGPQLKSSMQMSKYLQPVVVLKTLESGNGMSNSYHCGACQHTTNSVDHLIEHHYCCHSVYNFHFCKTCNLCLMRNDDAEKHWCDVTKESPQLPSDLSQQKKKGFERHGCNRCGLMFSKSYQFIKHMRTHTGKTPFKCNECGIYFAHAGSLQRHQVTPGRCKQTKIPVTNLDALSETKMPPPKELVSKKTYAKLPECCVKLVDICKTNMCNVCGKSFSTAEKAKKHFYNIHKGKNLDLSPSQSTTKLCDEKSQKERTETRGKCKCPLCPRLFKYSYNRARHLRDCVREAIFGGKEKVAGKYRCPLCHTTFTLPSNRIRHINTSCLRECVNRLAKERAEEKKTKETEQKQSDENEQKTLSKENEQKNQAPPALMAPKTCKTVPRYKCNLCPAVFCHPSGKYRHMKKHELFRLTGKMFRYRNSVFSIMSKPTTLSTTKTEESKDDFKPDEVKSCQFCGQCFSTSQSLKKHEHNHKGERPYRCLECGKGFKKRAYLFGHKIVHQRRIQCTVCRKILPTVRELIQHRSSHLKKGKLQCPDCHLQFQYPAYLLRHLDSHKNRENKAARLEERQLKPQQSLESVNEESGSKQLQCSLCKEMFNDAQVLRKHCLTHISGSSSNQCPFCKHNFTSRRYLLRHMIKHTGDKPFSCTNCGKQFYRDIYLKLHSKHCFLAQTKLVTLESDVKTKKSHQCSYCPRKFSKKIRLKNHHRGHKINSLLLCSKCGQYFGYTKLSHHQKNCIETEHNTGLSSLNSDNSKSTSQTDQNVDTLAFQTSATNKLHFKCPHCTQRFRYRSLLLRHLVSHTGLQPYACVHCGHRYRSQTMCLQHEAFCDGIYKEEQSKVKIGAAQQLSHMPTLREAAQKPHAESEAEYKCKFCTKTFMKPRNLRRHILTHNEVKPYRCKACDSCFSRYDHLKVHQARCKGKRSRLEVCIPKVSLDDVGTGWRNKFGIEPAEKQESFDCKICSRSFSTQSKLSRHNTMFHVTKLFKCTGCGSSFSHEKSLKKHRKMRRCRKVLRKANASLPLETNPSTENVTAPLDGVRSRILQRIQPHFNKKYKYICNYCPRAFGNSYQLSVHTRLHTGERPFACDYCGLRFIRKDYLQRHFQKCPKKTQQNKIPCDKCGGFFPQAKLENHKKSCTSTSSSSSTVCKSQQSASQSPQKGFSCAYCSSRFVLFSQLQEHFLNAHKMETMTPPVSTAPLQHHLSNIPKIKEEPLDESCDERLGDGGNLICKLDTALASEVPKPFSCPDCNMSFITKAGLTSHLRVHSRESAFRKCKFEHISERNTTQQLEVPLKAELDFALNDSVLVFKEGSKTTGTGVLQTNFSCKEDLMDESSQNSEDSEVKDGSSKETKAVQYQCSECDKSFTDGLMLISHLEDHGREEQKKKHNTCNKCGRVCSSQGHLEKHLKMHGIHKKYSCNDCSKMFYTSSDLEVHRTCHDLSRPYACKLCNQRFLTRPSLCNHYSEDHPDDVFTCRFCHKTYAVKKSLARHYRKWHQKEQNDHGRTVQEKRSTEKQSSSQVSTTGESDEDENNGSEDSDSDSAPYFPCHVCGKTFSTSESLEDHQRCHLGEKPHECAECGRCFFQASQLQQHQRMHQSEFQCQACGRGFVSLFALRKHKHTHGKSRPYRCSKCHFSFTGPSQLAEHMSTHREENFPCDICNRVFLSKSSRAEHRKNHSKSVDHHPNSISREEHKASASQELKYRCGVCSERFRDPEKLSEHGCMAAKERPYSCLDCNKHFLHASHLKKHRTTHQLSRSTSEYACDQCNKSFPSSQQFLSHLNSHVDTAAGIQRKTETKDCGPSHGFICPVCLQRFGSATELISHFPTHSDGTFKCKICKITFSSQDRLDEHEHGHQTSSTQFSCSVCGQSFLGSDSFLQHHCSPRQHAIMENENSNPSAKTSPTYHQAPGEEEEIDVTGEELYNCPVCSKQFSSKSGLLAHQNQQHPNEKPFRCELCGKTFALRRYLKEHERRHRQKSAAQNTAQSAQQKLKCTKCNSEFSTAQDLSLHMRFHAEKEVGEYRCDMCYKSFSQRSLLKQHQESHVGQVVYECNECDKAFAFPHLLEEHQQTHAGSSQ
uniref:zinc finger protein 1035 n=1 Tax=Scatophagus argus TaxID=75038 RepID=UPI001ED83288|nr:zinc finger protein 1035 [Scatophagus argus]XP_046255319.1 zinc finger protein 1035 [Scatophagus argus]